MRNKKVVFVGMAAAGLALFLAASVVRVRAQQANQFEPELFHVCELTTFVLDREAVIVVDDAHADGQPSKPDRVQRRGAAGGGTGVVSAVAFGGGEREETVPLAGSFFGGGQQVRVGAVVSGGNHFRHPDENDEG
jgi:hypothetical protein